MSTSSGAGSPASKPTFIEWLQTLGLEVATRAALAAAIPLVILVVSGRIDLLVYASFGAMTALFGRSEPYRSRTRSVVVGGAGMIASVVLGIVAAMTAAPVAVVALILVGVLVGGTVLISTFGLFPPTPLFFVFGFLICSEVPTDVSQVPMRVAVLIASAAFAALLTLSGWVLRRAAGSREPQLFSALARTPRVTPKAWRDRAVWISITELVLGALVAGGIALGTGVGHPAWAVVSLVAVVPPPGAAHSASRALHRIFGTIVGVAVAAAILLPGPSELVLVLVIAIGQFGAELLIGRHYGAALVFVTPLALSISHLASPTPVGELLLDRVVATAIGAAVGIVVVLSARWLVGRAPRPFRTPRMGPR